MKPRILVLDEPTAGLDPHGRSQLRALIARIHTLGITVIQVTHSMDDAATAEQVIVLSEGRLLMQGTPAEVFSAKTGAVLRENGLGLPNPLNWALSLEERGSATLGEPLTLDELADALVPQPTGAKGVSPDGL